MTLREFMRFHLLKALLGLVAIQIGVIAFVQNFNHRPKAQRDEVSIIEGRIAKVNPVKNDTDKDEDDELTLGTLSSPLHGIVEKNDDVVIYKPEKDFAGVDSFAYTSTDGRKQSKNGYITVIVNENLEPLANTDIVDAYNGKGIFIDVLSNDTDREGDSVFIKNFTKPVNGSLTFQNNRFLYVSDLSAAKDSFFYTLSDGKNETGNIPVIINISNKNHPCYPWSSCNIGDVAKPGNFSGQDKKLNIEGGGADIWNNADGFRFAYQYITGDCEIISMVESLEGTHQWAKAGLMIRETLNAGSKTAIVLISSKNGATYHFRSETGQNMQGADKIPDIKAPYWIKLVRKENNFGFFVSSDGNKWKNLGNNEISMGKEVFVGFAVTSHNNEETAKGVFSNYKLMAKEAKL